MKKSVVVLVIFALILGGCGEKKKEEVKEIKSETEAPAENKDAKESTASAGDIALGEKLFTEKTCTTCHQIDTKVIGPSVKDIMKIYREKNANVVDFLKSKSEPIVDTDPGQVAIMKANLEGFVKDLTEEELAALGAYMSSIK